MANIRNSYKELCNYYLREARSCAESAAYRMSIISAATSVHIACYYVLLNKGVFDQDERIENFHEVVLAIKKHANYSSIADDVEWLINARNAVAHPDEWIIPEMEIDEMTGIAKVKISEKIKELPSIKKKVYLSTMETI